MRQQLFGEAQQEHQIWNRAEVSVAVKSIEVRLHYKGVGVEHVKYVLYHRWRKACEGNVGQCDLCVPPGI